MYKTNVNMRVFLNVVTVVVAVFMMTVGFVYAEDKKKQSKQEQFVQALGQEALETLDKDDLSEDEISKVIRKWLNSYFDAKTIARFALGRYWRSASKAEKAEYTDLFEDLIVVTYSKRLAEYSGEKFQVVNYTKVNDRDTVVHSRILPANDKGPSVQVDWRVRTVKGKPRIIDVIVEGISMSVTQRSDFASIIQRGGGSLEVLLTSLRKKTGKPAKADKD